MSRWILVTLISVFILWWLFQNVRIERRNHVEYLAPKGSVYDFLKNPDNLVKVHPNIVKIFKIVSDHSRVTFQFEENLPWGATSFSMTLVYDDDESTLLFQTNSFVANVTVKLQMVDPGRSEPDPETPLAVTIQQTVAVETWRLVSYPLSFLIADIWESTVKASITQLDDQSPKVSEERLSHGEL